MLNIAKILKWHVRVAAIWLATMASMLFAQVDVLTYHNDLARTGLNTNETILTPANVNSNNFGLLFSCFVDGQVYAQPLYVSGVDIPGVGTRNVVFVATQHNSVYAFDADSNAGPNNGLLWRVNFGPPAQTPNNVWVRYGPFHDIEPEVGITATPVIDRATGTLYANSYTFDGTNFSFHIHALNITNGAEQSYSPALVTGAVPGIGVQSTNGMVRFNARYENGRVALTLAGGVLYSAYASYGDTDPYHGWVIGYNATNLVQLTNYVFNTTPNSSVALFGTNAGEGGIWMSGAGIAVDDQTNLFFGVGNGSFNATTGTEYGSSFVKLTTTGDHLAVGDYFTPSNQATLNANDLDIGSGGVVLLPNEVGSVAHPHLCVSSAKSGIMFLMDRDNMGHYHANGDQIVQEVSGAIDAVFCTPAYFNGVLYYQSKKDYLKAFKFSNGLLQINPISKSLDTNTTYHGTTPSISANGTNDAIVWTINTDAYVGGPPVPPAVLHAYNATNLAQELYSSSQIPDRDSAGGAIKFTVPTIANGKVYVAGQNTLAVYGNGTFLAPQVISPDNRFSTSPITVSISETNDGATIYYTLDGTPPTTNAIPYTGPFQISQTTLVQAKAFKDGAVPSALAKYQYTIPTGVYEKALILNGPVSYFRFNDVNFGTVYDSFNGAYDGRHGLLSIPESIGPRPPVFPGFGTNNYAVQTGGVLSWVKVQPLNLNTNTVTITAWLYPFGNQQPFTGIYMCRNGNDASGFNYTTGNQLGYTWNNNSSQTWNWLSGVTVPTNQWSLVALVVTPTNASVFRFSTNGFAGATNNLNHSSESFNVSPLIGDDLSAPTRAFNGFIDEVAVFKYSLSLATLKQIYNAATNKPALPPVTITAQSDGTNISLVWPRGTLQETDVVTGPWVDVSNATSPYPVTQIAPVQFYRVKVQ